MSEAGYENENGCGIFHLASARRGARVWSCAEEEFTEVGKIMTARFVTVEMDDRLDVVKQIFDTLNFHHLLVIDDRKKLTGIVS